MAWESQSASSLKFVVDKVSFVNKLPVLNKATYDDAQPTPGYLYQEICNISYERGSFCSDLLDFLVSRLDKKSYHVKLKVLRIMRFTVENGHHEFRQGLRRKAHGIRESTKFGGPPDPLHGNAPYVLVRKEAKELCRLLFDVQETEDMQNVQMESAVVMSQNMGGMGSGTGKSVMQGFGNAPVKEASLTESIVEGIKDFAGKIMDPAPGIATSGVSESDKFFSSYKPVQFGQEETIHTEESSKSVELSSNVLRDDPGPSRKFLGQQKRRRAHRPGVAGGGWADSEDDDDDIRKDNEPRQSLMSDGRQPTEEHIPSTGSRPSSATSTGNTQDGPIGTRLDEWAAEKTLVKDIVGRDEILVKRAHLDHFIKCCSSLNCSRIVEIVGDHLKQSSEKTQLHCLQLVEALLRTDLVAPDEIASFCRQGLDLCYKSQDAQIAIKAKKVILILGKLCSEGSSISDILQRPDALRSPVTTRSSTDSESEMFVSSFSFIKEPLVT